MDAQAVRKRISPRPLTVAAGDLTPDRQVDVERLTKDTV